MTARFLVKTSLAPGQVLRLPDGPVLDAYPRLRDALNRHAGPLAAELLAEPVVTWSGDDGEGTVSWYSGLPGEALPLSQVPAGRRAQLEERLRAVLARIAPLLADPDVGPALQRGLCLRTSDSIWAVGDQVVLTEWGAVPVGVQAATTPGDMLARSPTAPFMPVAGSSPGPVQATAAALPPTFVPPQPAPIVPVRRNAAAWLVVPAALLVAAAFLGLGYWRGSVLADQRAAARPNTVSVLDDDAARRALDQQNLLNASLTKQIEERRRLLAGNVCVADPATLPRLGPDRAARPPQSVVPPPPGGQPFRGTLADLLKQSIVMVLVPHPGGMALGTGFFVTPDLIVTNRHVVEEAQDGNVAVVNVKLGHPIRGKVVATTPTSDIGSLDLAIIRVPPPGNIQPLSFTTTAAELDPVIAAGYPALITGADAGMHRLLDAGDLSAAPQLVLTDGRIEAIQTSSAGIKIMPHGASISGGNSGGPLVDGCGRVVGINTFVRADRESAAHANYAQKTDSLLPFLKAHGAAVTELSGPCAPDSPSAPPPVSPIAAVPPPANPAPATLATPAPATPAPATPAPATPAPAAPR